MPRFFHVHYAWVVVGITCLVLLTSAGIRSTPGILMVPLEQEFHWSRTTISFAVSLNLILYGLIGPFAATIMDRYGVRRCVLLALSVVGAGVALTSFMQYPWQLILMWGLLVGAGTGFLATVLAATVAARWFTEKQGLVVGILSGGASTTACIDHGYSEISGAALLATMGVFNFIGTTSSGWLSDKFDNRALLAIYYSLRGLSLFYLPFAFFDPYAMTIFAIFYGLDWLATISPTIRILTNTFGKERAPLVYGWVFACHQLGGGAAAVIAGLIRTTFNDYFSAFILAGAMCLVAALAVLFINLRNPTDHAASAMTTAQ